MHDARPDGEGDQAAVISRVPCSGNQKNAEDRIDAADHLQIVGALTAMPDLARRPHEAERIDQPEDDAENNEREFQIALSGLVVHGFLPSALLGFLADLSLPLRIKIPKKCAASISSVSASRPSHGRTAFVRFAPRTFMSALSMFALCT
jgi:hypothetical protein